VHTVRFDNAGNPWIIDTQSQTVAEVHPGRKVLLTSALSIKPAKIRPIESTQRRRVRPNGDLYVSDGYGNDRVVVFDKMGSRSRLGKARRRARRFSQPHSIALDSRGRVICCRPQQLAHPGLLCTGKFLTEWKNIITPCTRHTRK